MSISSHQHRNLRRSIIIAFTLILLLCIIGWFFVNQIIKDNIIGLAKDNNRIVAVAVGDVIQASEKNFIDKLNNVSSVKIIKSESYANITIKANGYLNEFDIEKINIINKTGEIIFSTKPEDIGKKNKQQAHISRVFQGASESASVENEVTSEIYNASTNRIISYIPLKEKNKTIAVLEIVTNVKNLNENIFYIKYLSLIGIVIGALLLLGMFYYILKYSDDLVNKYAKQIVTQSKSDPITGLINRHHFFRYIRKSVARTLQQNARSALLIIDIDHFKELNAKYDHTFGDEVLKILVQRLTRILGASDTLARTGDDEFSILVEQSGSNSSIQDFARKILDKINEPVQIDANFLHLTCSIGISVINQDSKDMEELVHHADSALYNAKDFGRNNFQLFSRGGGARHLKFYDKQFALSKALEENEYILHIQPKINGATGEIVGGEALLRWENPDYGLVPPLEFLPALEKSGLIHNVGKWVLENACHICKDYQDKYNINVPISVNVSALQFKKEDFVSGVSDILRSTELDGNMLEMELTETCLMDNVEYSLYILKALKEMGIRIAIDDFGTGYSSLNYLKRFPIDVLKIDRSFISNVDDRANNDNAAIVTAIMALSHSLRLDTVAEGIETAHELSYLSALGCKTVQGFLFSKPLPVGEYIYLLRNNETVRRTLENVRDQLA